MRAPRGGFHCEYVIVAGFRGGSYRSVRVASVVGAWLGCLSYPLGWVCGSCSGSRWFPVLGSAALPRGWGWGFGCCWTAGTSFGLRALPIWVGCGHAAGRCAFPYVVAGAGLLLRGPALGVGACRCLGRFKVLAFGVVRSGSGSLVVGVGVVNSASRAEGP